jgi:hypothetical protein
MLPALLLGPVAGPALAQEGAECRGRCLSFGIDQRFSTTDNLALEIPDEGTTNQSITSLDFGFLSETATDVLRFDLDGVLRYADGPDVAKSGLNLTDRGAALAYARTGANSAFDLRAYLRENDLEFFDPLADLREQGLPDDFETLGNEGTRRVQGAQIGYDWGTEGPFSLGLNAGFEDISYRDEEPPEEDTDRSNFGATLGFALSPVLDARLGVSRRYYDEVENESVAERQSTRVSAGFDLERPAGLLNGQIYTNDTPEGTETGFSLGTVYERPLLVLEGRLGLVRGVEGDIYPAGELRLERSLPNGRINALVFQDLQPGSNDLETLRSGLSLGLSQGLGQLATLSLDLNYVTSEETDDGATTDEGSLGARLSYVLTEDWLMDLGYRYRMRDEGQQASSNELFLGIRRDFARNY